MRYYCVNDQAEVVKLMKTSFRALHKILITGLCLLMISACANISYYSQSVIGHSRLMLARQSVDKVLSNADSELARQLILSKELKRFAIEELGLPDSKSYDSYVPLEREFPVWAVVAAPEFSVNPKLWCYPVIGCASYRGYFKQQNALDYAAQLSSQGYETEVGGASAYSTLGWFADPLLPSMMRYGDLNFAETLFHELAHQLVYINGDSSFNEAFATVVGQQGVIRWLQKYRSTELETYRRQIDATEQFNQLLSQYKQRLNELYLGSLGDQDKRHAKQELFEQLKSDYQRLKQEQWAGKGWYESWFSKPINNARLASFSTYYERVSKFNELLVACENDLEKFYQTIFHLKKNPLKDGNKVLIPSQCLME